MKIHIKDGDRELTQYVEWSLKDDYTLDFGDSGCVYMTVDSRDEYNQAFDVWDRLNHQIRDLINELSEIYKRDQTVNVNGIITLAKYMLDREDIHTAMQSYEQANREPSTN